MLINQEKPLKGTETLLQKMLKNPAVESPNERKGPPMPGENPPELERVKSPTPKRPEVVLVKKNLGIGVPGYVLEPVMSPSHEGIQRHT